MRWRRRATGIGVSVEERPVGAGVGGFVDAGFVAGAGAHQENGPRVDGADAAEIEGFGAGDRGGGPGDAAIEVTSQVPPLPLANTVRASTALTPRSEARVLLVWGAQVCARSVRVQHSAVRSFIMCFRASLGWTRQSLIPLVL